MYMLIMVLDDSARLNEVLQAWIDAGVKGVTILESTGVNRVLPRDSASPMYAGFTQIFGSGRVGHNTLFAVIEEMTTADAAVKATEAILGDLTKPHTGIIFALPVSRTWGVPEPYAHDS
jgi:nitrogen regulatory protein P-II 1